MSKTIAPQCFMFSRRSFVLSLPYLLLGGAARAGLPQPTGDVILTITGAMTETNAPHALQFDMAMLRALPSIEVSTASPWTNGVTRFKGVELKTLLDLAGASGTKLSAIALNDYAATIPVADATEKGAFIAYLMDGAEMSVRERGPLWVLYPFDQRPELKAEEYYSRAVWQLKAIDIKP